jgi:Fic family protein
VQQNNDNEWAGRYRNRGVIIGGADHKPPEALGIPKLMRNLIDWVGDNKKIMHPKEISFLLGKIMFLSLFKGPFDKNPGDC